MCSSDLVGDLLGRRVGDERRPARRSDLLARGLHDLAEVIADEIGPSLRWAQAQVEKTARTTGEGGQQTSAPAPMAPAPADHGYTDEEPF